MVPWWKKITHLSAWFFISVATPSTSVSQSAQRVEGNFMSLSSLSNSSVGFPEDCPTSFNFTSINTYRYINPENETEEYDGILWEDLFVNGSSCKGSNYDTTATYFKIPPNPSEDCPILWFLTGWDNSNLFCPPYQAKYTNRYFFTDDLPAFREYLIQCQFLPEEGVGSALRGDVYLFTRGFEGNDIEATLACAYKKDEVVDDEPGPSDEAGDGEGPACLSGTTRVMMADGSVKPMSSISLGDKVRRGTSESADGMTDIVLSFSHRDAVAWTLFLSLTVKLEGVSRNSTVPAASARRKIIDEVTIQLTADHLVPVVGGTMVRAAELRVSDRLVLQREQSHGLRATISRIAQIRSRGVYAPVTMSGHIVLESGIVVSCYTDAVGAMSSHALLTPVRALFVAGLGLDWCPFVDVFRKLVFPP